MINKNIITGDNIRLRPLKEGDMILKVKWYNDPMVRKTLVVDEAFELEKTVKWFHSLETNGNRVDFMVEAMDDTPIAITGIVDIDHKNKTAQCYCVIGEKEYWGKHLGTEIHSVLFQWAFTVFDIKKIWADIRTNNPAIYRVVEKLGFEVEGTLRKEKVVDGQRIDLYRIGLLQEEFRPAHVSYKVI